MDFVFRLFSLTNQNRSEINYTNKGKLLFFNHTGKSTLFVLLVAVYIIKVFNQRNIRGFPV